jgi:hypothetical protein
MATTFLKRSARSTLGMTETQRFKKIKIYLALPTRQTCLMNLLAFDGQSRGIVPHKFDNVPRSGFDRAGACHRYLNAE